MRKQALLLHSPSKKHRKMGIKLTAVSPTISGAQLRSVMSRDRMM